MTPRYVVRCTYKNHSGERDPFAIPWVRTTLGREEIILGLSIRCWAYMYEYGSSGRDKKQTGPGTRKKAKKGTHTTVRRRTAVAHNIPDQAYPMNASIA